MVSRDWCPGDHAHTARADARQIGLVRFDDPVVITGDRLARLSDAQLQLALDATRTGEPTGFSRGAGMVWQSDPICRESGAL